MKKTGLMLSVLVISGMLSVSFAEEMAKPAAAPAKMEKKASRSKSRKAAAKKAEAASAETKKSVYKCEHCNVTSDKPGKCSMCGMDLKKT